MYEDDDPVKVYLNQMGKVPPLTREQESECVRHIRSRDEQADDAMRDLVEPVLPSVVAIAQKHPSDQLHILEMIQIGNQALMTAARAFADSDFRFRRALHRKRHRTRRHHPKLLTTKYTTGSANKLLSSRSNQPPCPGSKLPLSFTPAPRLMADSHKSPN